MKTGMLQISAALALVLCGIAKGASSASSASSAATHSDMATRIILVHGHHLAFHVLPGHFPILVLDAGGGADSSYWDSIVPELAKRTGSEIITYDRAGFGASDEVQPPYRVENAVTDLESGLQQLGATHDLILIPHSYSGMIVTYLAIRDPKWILGAVLVDTNVPDFFTKGEVAHLAEITGPMVAAEAAQHPDKTTRTLQAISGTYVETNNAFHEASWPASVPCTVIVSDGTPFPPQMKSDSTRWIQAHIDFAKRSPNRTLVIAHGSSHDVAHNHPEIILDAVTDLIGRLAVESHHD